MSLVKRNDELSLEGNRRVQPHRTSVRRKISVPASVTGLLLLALTGCAGLNDTIRTPEPREVTFRFPGDGAGLDADSFWYRAKATHGGGRIQQQAYDLSAVRHDETLGWTRLRRGVSPGGEGRNADYLAYGQKVYAISGGLLTHCWRNAPENPPGGRHPEFDKGRILGGGNSMYIELTSGARVFYAHFQPGSIPSELCPNDEVFFDKAEGDTSVLPPDKRVWVQKGQFLGLVGNSGNSSGPHLHIHLETGGDQRDPAELEFEWFVSRGIDGNPSVEEDWRVHRGDPLPPGPLAIIATPSGPPVFRLAAR